MAKNPYATNETGKIKAIHPVKEQPKTTTIKGSDLRTGK